MYKTLDITSDSSVATISLNRPESLNAFNLTLREELLVAIRAVSSDQKIRVIVLQGRGRAFCAGADLAEVTPVDQTVEQRLNTQYKPIILELRNAPKPVIAAVNGAAAGIGCALALACDMVVMTQRAYLYQAFSSVGLIPDGGATWMLPRLIGEKRAFELMVLGEKISASQCLALGLINRVVEEDALQPEIDQLVSGLLAKAPLSLLYTKEAIRQSATLSLEDAISMEAALQLKANTSRDHAEGKAAFLEKRPASWLGE